MSGVINKHHLRQESFRKNSFTFKKYKYIFLDKAQLIKFKTIAYGPYF